MDMVGWTHQCRTFWLPSAMLLDATRPCHGERKRRARSRQGSGHHFCCGAQPARTQQAEDPPNRARSGAFETPLTGERGRIWRWLLEPSNGGQNNRPLLKKGSSAANKPPEPQSVTDEIRST